MSKQKLYEKRSTKLMRLHNTLAGDQVVPTRFR